MGKSFAGNSQHLFELLIIRYQGEPLGHITLMLSN